MKDMKGRYLIANPFGAFMVRCDTMEQVNEFVIEHFKKTQDSYRILMSAMGETTELKVRDYKVRDLEEIPIYKGE